MCENMETKEANITALQSDAELTYEMHREAKAYLGEFMALEQKHEEQRKQETAAEAEREAKHGKRNRLSQWWYDLIRSWQEDDWNAAEQELLDVANPLMAMARFKEHQKK